MQFVCRKVRSKWLKRQQIVSLMKKVGDKQILRVCNICKRFGLHYRFSKYHYTHQIDPKTGAGCGTEYKTGSCQITVIQRAAD